MPDALYLRRLRERFGVDINALLLAQLHVPDSWTPGFDEECRR